MYTVQNKRILIPLLHAHLKTEICMDIKKIKIDILNLKLIILLN